MAAKGTPPQQVKKLHNEMVQELGKLFSVKGKDWSNICYQIVALGLLSNADMGEVKSMDGLFFQLIKSNDNKIKHGNYTEVYEIFNGQHVEAGHIMKDFTQRIKTAVTEKGERKHNHDSESESEDEHLQSKQQRGKRKSSRDSDCETIDEKTKRTRRRGYRKYSGDSDSGSDADDSKSKRRKENAGNLRKEHDDTHDARIVFTWQKGMKAVGLIQGPISCGTGFRVGKDKIMTAYHVLKDITRIHKGADPDLSYLGTDKVFITFNFLAGNNSENPPKTWYFEEKYVGDDKMDFVILQLRNDDNTKEASYPEAIKRFKPVHPEQTFALLGHPNGKPMQLDPKVHIFNPKIEEGQERLQKMKIWAREQGHNSAYKDIQDEEKILFDCWVQHGASGSPGIEMDSDGEPVCSLMLIRGFPEFVFDDGYNITKEHHQYMIEQGVTMKAIAATLKRKGREAKEIMQEIFTDNDL